MSTSGNKSKVDSFDPNFDMEESPSTAAAPTTAQTSNGSQAQQSSTQSTTTASEDEARKAKLKAALANVQSWQPEGVPLSQSGAYVPTAAPAAQEPQYEEYMEDVDGFSDGDASRDLCSFPCINCGAVPSFAMYELCGKCLDEMSPT